jgi:hypothetical protein
MIVVKMIRRQQSDQFRAWLRRRAKRSRAERADQLPERERERERESAGGDGHVRVTKRAELSGR